MPFGEQSAIIGDMMEEEESHGGKVLVEMESLRSSHPHPQVLHLILIVYGEVSSGEHGRRERIGRG